MGREWYWGSSKTITSTSSVPSTISTTTTTTKKKNEEMSSINKGTQPGCMSGVLHLFDFHQFQFPITTQSPCFKPNTILQDDPTFTKGVEAPRNSLESESSPMFSTELKEEEDFHVPVEIRVPIATSAKDKEFGAGKTRNDGEVSCSDSSSSPGPKTPSLVARLMGLDLLPDTLSPYPSPSPSSRKSEEIYRHNVQQQQHRQNQNQNQTTNNKQRKMSRNNSLIENEMRYETTGSRSLPDTPRISSARRSDVDARFSLQINNKENMINNGDEFDYLNRISRDEKSRQNELRNEEDSRSPGHYARQIVKQVKESVSRRVGLDITNTTNKRFNTKEEVEVVLLKSKKPKRLSKIGEESTSNSPPRLRLFCEETKSAAFRDQVSLPQKLSSSNPYSSSSPPISRLECNKVKSKISAKPKSKSQAAVPQQEKCKKASCERFTQRKHVGRSSEPEKKSQSTHGSKEIAARRSSSSSTEAPSSSSTSTSTSTSSCQIQVSKEINSRLSSSSSRRTTWSWCVSPLLNDSNNDPTNFADEIRYVSEILKCTGIHKHTLVSFTQWFSPSHPLDPSIFLYLENDTVPIKHRCNRRLLFNLMDEMLANFLKPYLNMKPWFEECNQFVQNGMRGEALLQWLCDEMRRFPSSNCENLEDIDSLIDRDLPDERIRTLPLCEETESIVFEIEQDILDTLVHETAADIIVKQKRRHELGLVYLV